MEPQHEQSLKAILKKQEKEFVEWLGTLSDEEIGYVEWLLEKADDVLDELLLDQYGLVEANKILKEIMDK